MLRVALYARVSTLEQQTENQLAELRRYVAARGWPTPVEYIDHGVSGAKERRPALDRLIADARRRRLDVVVCWRLDRLGRNLKHLVHCSRSSRRSASRSSRSPKASMRRHRPASCSSTSSPPSPSSSASASASGCWQACNAPGARESDWDGHGPGPRRWTFLEGLCARRAHLGRLEVDGGPPDHRESVENLERVRGQENSHCGVTRYESVGPRYRTLVVDSGRPPGRAPGGTRHFPHPWATRFRSRCRRHSSESGQIMCSNQAGQLQLVNNTIVRTSALEKAVTRFRRVRGVTSRAHCFEHGRWAISSKPAAVRSRDASDNAASGAQRGLPRFAGSQPVRSGFREDGVVAPMPARIAPTRLASGYSEYVGCSPRQRVDGIEIVGHRDALDPRKPMNQRLSPNDVVL